MPRLPEPLIAPVEAEFGQQLADNYAADNAYEDIAGEFGHLGPVESLWVACNAVIDQVKPVAGSERMRTTATFVAGYLRDTELMLSFDQGIMPQQEKLFRRGNFDLYAFLHEREKRFVEIHVIGLACLQLAGDEPGAHPDIRVTDYFQGRNANFGQSHALEWASRLIQPVVARRNHSLKPWIEAYERLLCRPVTIETDDQQAT